jgi:hypothetical protein
MDGKRNARHDLLSMESGYGQKCTSCYPMYMLAPPNDITVRNIYIQYIYI